MMERPGHTRRCATVASFRTWRGSRPRVVPTTNLSSSRCCVRRGWDSNPRYPFRYTRVPGVRLQPLGHLSSPSGERRIRTYGTVAGTPDFESGAFDHSASSPAIQFSDVLPQTLEKPGQPLRAFDLENLGADLQTVVVRERIQIDEPAQRARLRA